MLFKQTYINLDEYNDADYVNFDMAEEAQWNESRRLWGYPVYRPPSPQEKSENQYLGHHSKTTYRKIVYGGHVFFPECVENDLIGCYS